MGYRLGILYGDGDLFPTRDPWGDGDGISGWGSSRVGVHSSDVDVLRAPLANATPLGSLRLGWKRERGGSGQPRGSGQRYGTA
jgi:hypothetical protein